MSQATARQEDPFRPGLLSRFPGPPRRVVVVRASRIGDFICATPAFRAIRRALPEAEITLVALPFARGLVARSRDLDRFEPFPGVPGIAEQFFEPGRALAFFTEMQARRFDLAVQLHGSGVYANPFTLMLGARVTAGFVRPGDGPGRLEGALPIPGDGHEVDRALALASFIGAPPVGTRTTFELWAEDRAEAAYLLANAEPPLFGLHPTATEATKRWDPRGFAAVGEHLRDRYGGTVVVVGGPGERATAQLVSEAVGVSSVNLAGRTSLPVLGAVLERLTVLVTNDSGPAHIAYALGVPSVTIFGATDPRAWGPHAPHARHVALAHPVPCRPCGHETCPVGDLCLLGLTVQQVTEAAELAIGATREADSDVRRIA